MKVLFQGLYSLFAPAGTKPALYNDLSGKFYNTEAPQNTNYPYGVMHLIANDYDWTFTENLEEFLVQMTLYDDNSSPDNITDYYENLKVLYDWATPIITGYQLTWMVREFSELLRLDDVWQYIIQYRILTKQD